MVQVNLGQTVSMDHKKVRPKVMVETDNVKLCMLLIGSLIHVTRFDLYRLISHEFDKLDELVLIWLWGWFKKNLDTWNWCFIPYRKSLFTWCYLEKLPRRRLLKILSRPEFLMACHDTFKWSTVNAWYIHRLLSIKFIIMILLLQTLISKTVVVKLPERFSRELHQWSKTNYWKWFWKFIEINRSH